MIDSDKAVLAVALPHASRLAALYATATFADAYAVKLPSHATTDPEQLARFILLNQAPWVAWLMKVRDAMVAGFGLKTAHQLQPSEGSRNDRRVHIFKIYDTLADEILLGEDDRHLDFRMSILRQQTNAEGGGADLTLTTVVMCHNRLGRAYIKLIAPFHRAIVRDCLRRAARTGWPAASKP